MSIWKRIPLLLISASIVAGLAYITLVTMLNEGRELGEPAWEGYLVQWAFMSLLSLIGLTFVAAPTMIILSRYPIDTDRLSIIYCSLIFIVLILVFMFLVGVNWFGAIIPALAGTIGVLLLDSRLKKAAK